MAKILLVNPPVRVLAKPNNIPIGLGTIAHVLQHAGHQVEVYDCNVLRPTIAEVSEHLWGKKWDFIGVGGLVTTLKWIREFLGWNCRYAARGTKTVVGGGLATSLPEMVHKELCPTYTVVGEGEWAMLAIVGGKEPPGIVRYPNTVNLDSIPFPAWELFPEDYLCNPIWGKDAKNSSGIDYEMKKSMNTVSSRGCRRNCAFCYHLFGKSSYRIRSAGNVVAEAKELVKRYNIDFLGFSDDNLVLDRQRAIDIAEGLGKLGLRWGCHSHVTGIDEDLLCVMRDNGCVWIGFGFEHFHPEMLKAMNKGVREEDNIRALEMVRKVGGMFPNTTFIYGYPGETKETAWYSARRMKELGLACPRFFATPYPGTKLYDETKHLHPLDLIEKLGDATDFVVNLTEMPTEELLALKGETDEYILGGRAGPQLPEEAVREKEENTGGLP